MLAARGAVAELQFLAPLVVGAKLASAHVHALVLETYKGK